VVGAEGKGLSRLVMERCDALVRIPLQGRVASLNAASAAAVVLFEAARRRRAATPSTKS
jgi:23S rRNA (guanosine2251-2'-O)-methyltransferase